MVLTRTVANGCERLRTVANGCDHKHNVERTHPQPPDPQSETGTLATHSGKVHAVVARSTFRSQNVQNTPWSDHFWKLRCRKSARCCGANEAHFEVKMCKTHHVRTTLGGSDVEKVHAVVARRTFRSKNVQNTRGSDHFLHYRTLHYTTLQYTTLHYTTLQYTPLH